MAQIFISYAREDRQTAERLAHALQEKGFTLWWDWNLIGGADFRVSIRDAIRKADKAVVLWSEHSVKSGFVIDEATEAKKLRKLVPLRIDECETPYGFGDVHTIDFQDIDRDLDTLVAALNDLPPPGKPPAPSRRSFVLGAAAGVVGLTAALGGAAYHFLSRQQNHAGNRMALVIGNSNYRNLPVIANTIPDAKQTSKALEKLGFRVVISYDLDRAAMESSIMQFETMLAVYGGVGLFYYSGSAAFIDGEDVLIPVDASVDWKRGTILGGVNLSQLTKQISSRTTSSLANNGTALIYSASKGQVASDGPVGGHSPFNTAFLKSFSDEDELSDTFRKISDEMAKVPKLVDRRTGKEYKQAPYFEGNLGFRFYFNHPNRDPREGVARILIFDSCRDNPFKLDVANR